MYSRALEVACSKWLSTGESCCSLPWPGLFAFGGRIDWSWFGNCQVSERVRACVTERKCVNDGKEKKKRMVGWFYCRRGRTRRVNDRKHRD